MPANLPPPYFEAEKRYRLEELAAEIHKDLVTRLKFAKVGGSGVFGGQQVRCDYVLNDGDVVEMNL